MDIFGPIRLAVDVVSGYLIVLPEVLPRMASDDTDDLLEELRRAAEIHKKILERQSELIRRLREELKEVKR